MPSRPRYHVLMPGPGSMDRSPFAALMETLVWGLRQAGHEASCSFVSGREDATQIVLCPHLLDAATRRRLPAATILYNLEPLAPASALPPSRLDEFRDRRIWDYSVRNLDLWQTLGIAATLLPLGWYPGLERVGAAAEDIDILFYGALNFRREAVLNGLSRRGLRVIVCDRVFGAELDALIARARIVLNIHFYPAHILETMRVSYLLANGRAVVSERSARTEIPAAYEDAVCWAPYEQLADRCVELLGDEGRRAALGAAGRTAMRRLPVTPLVERALAAVA